LFISDFSNNELIHEKKGTGTLIKAKLHLIVRPAGGKYALTLSASDPETGKKAPIIGFIFFKEETKEFGGRFMSLVGPALYFKGTYQED